MSFKSAISSVGSGLLSVTQAIHNGPIDARISEIDEEIEKLQREKARLEDQRIDD